MAGNLIEWDGAALRALAAEHGWKAADRKRPHFVYRVFDAEDRLLYIGRTWHPWRRFAGHKRSPWMSYAHRVDWEFVGDYEDAKRAEARAILHEHPIYNRQYTIGDRAGRVAAYEATAGVAA